MFRSKILLCRVLKFHQLLKRILSPERFLARVWRLYTSWGCSHGDSLECPPFHLRHHFHDWRQE